MMIRTRLDWWLSVLAVVVVSVARQASAYTGDICQGATWQDTQHITYTTSGQLRVSSSTPSDVDVVCPIIKTNSGPGVTNDAITSATVSFANANPYPANCWLSIYKAAAGRTAINLHKRYPKHIDSGRYLTIDASVDPVTQYWKGIGLIGGDSWYYAQVECTLKPGAIIKYVGHEENGVDQPGSRILPSSYCYNQNGPAYRTFYFPAATQGFMTASNAPPGSNPPGESGFRPLCKAPPGTGAAVQISIGAGAYVSGYQVSCNTTQNMGVQFRTWTYDPNIINSQLQWVLTFTAQPEPEKFGPGLLCQMLNAQGNAASNGDAWIFSYRTASASFKFGLW